MLLLVGLGNPGNKYDHTPHNIGFMVIDYIIQEFSLPPLKQQFNSLVSLYNIFNKKIILLKPGVFMNNSGYSVLQVVSFYKIKPENIIVFHDDIDLQFGKVRLKKGGSSAGHNGIKSIDNVIGKDYWRVRFGVDKPASKYEIADYVLSKFQQLPKIQNVIAIVVNNISLLIDENKSLFITKLKIS